MTKKRTPPRKTNGQFRKRKKMTMAEWMRKRDAIKP